MHYSYRRLAEGRYQERHGLAFEEFAPGQRFRHRPGMTLSQQDNADEALDTLNGAMLHYDAHYAAATAWQRPLMVSTLTLQRVLGMASKTYARRGAIREFQEISLLAPLFGGDTLYAASEILACNTDERTLTVRFTGHKQDGTDVAGFTCVLEMPATATEAGEPVEQPRFAAYHVAENGVLLEQWGVFFEEFNAGEEFVHAPRRSFFAGEVAEHAWRSQEFEPQYQDLDWIARHTEGRQQVPEALVVSAATALSTRTFGRVVANLGWTDVKLPRPVFVGDTIAAESRILGMRDSASRPDEGILTVETRAWNQRDETVLRYRRVLLVYRRRMAGLYRKVGY